MNIWMDLDETSCDLQLCLWSKRFIRFIALSRGLRPLTTLARIKCFLPINHERMDGSWWYLQIWLILWDVKFIQRSRSQGHRSRSHMHLCNFWPIYCISRVRICTLGKGFICDKNGRDFKFTSSKCPCFNCIIW